MRYEDRRPEEDYHRRPREEQYHSREDPRGDSFFYAVCL